MKKVITFICGILMMLCMFVGGFIGGLMILILTMMGPLFFIWVLLGFFGYDLDISAGWIMISMFVWIVFREWGSRHWSDHKNPLIGFIFTRCEGWVPHEWW